MFINGGHYYFIGEYAAMPELNYVQELSRLDTFERQLISQGQNRFDSSMNEKIFRTLSPLRKAISQLREYENENDVINTDMQYKVSYLVEQLSEVIDRFIRTVNNARSAGIINVVLEETSEFIDRVNDIGSKEPLAQQTERTAELEAMLTSTQRSLLENESELKKIREAMLTNYDQTKRAEQSAKNAENLAKRAANAATKIATNQISDEWSDEYSKYIEPDQRFVKQVKEMQEQREKELENTRISIAKFAIKGWFALKIQWIDKIRGGAFYSVHSYVNTSRRWRNWRSFYFVMLLVCAGIYVYYVATHKFPNQDELLHYVIEKIMFAPIIVIISIGFVFAGRNYRIAANRLEDYRHNFIVARTLQNLMKIPEAKDGNLLSLLLEKGASTLFAHRPSGYMNKVNTEDGLIQALIDKIPSGNKS